jgi:hypothetical protein
LSHNEHLPAVLDEVDEVVLHDGPRNLCSCRAFGGEVAIRT